MVSFGCKYHSDIFKTFGCSGGKYYLKEASHLIKELERYRSSNKKSI